MAAAASHRKDGGILQQERRRAACEQRLDLSLEVPKDVGVGFLLRGAPSLIWFGEDRKTGSVSFFVCDEIIGRDDD